VVQVSKNLKMKIAILLITLLVAVCHTAPPTEDIRGNMLAIENLLAKSGKDFTAEQKQQLVPLIRSRRFFNPFSKPEAKTTTPAPGLFGGLDIIGIIFRVLREILELPEDSSPIAIVITLFTRILGLNVDGNDVAEFTGDVARQVGNII